ncbi:Histone-lysine N-methyltransferase atxr3 [Castilleja foliolosa]|uniref:Histone-lysine N-methyltransferase atxr3 n=1 Tax=Castilleja foliolosa TaxID=1961234 RepID=A0ABD3E377_9LAMI
MDIDEESGEKYEASVCLCSNHVCLGSYLYLTREGTFQKVLKCTMDYLIGFVHC